VSTPVRTTSRSRIRASRMRFARVVMAPFRERCLSCSGVMRPKHRPTPRDTPRVVLKIACRTRMQTLGWPSRALVRTDQHQDFIR